MTSTARLHHSPISSTAHASSWVGHAGNLPSFLPVPLSLRTSLSIRRALASRTELGGSLRQIKLLNLTFDLLWCRANAGVARQ